MSEEKTPYRYVDRESDVQTARIRYTRATSPDVSLPEPDTEEDATMDSMLFELLLRDAANGEPVPHKAYYTALVMLRDAKARIAELEAENARLCDAWLVDEGIQVDGSLRPSLSATLQRLDDALHQNERLPVLEARIAELIRERDDAIEAVQIMGMQQTRLEAIAAAAELDPPIYKNRFGANECWYCGFDSWHNGAPEDDPKAHMPDCPWAVLRLALATTRPEPSQQGVPE